MARTSSFSVKQRNPRHWDVGTDGKRAFRIRGRGSEGISKEGCFCVIGEQPHEGIMKDGFETLSGAMGWVTDYLMHEEISTPTTHL